MHRRTLLLLIAIAACAAGPAVSASIAEGDLAFRGRVDPAQAQKALADYRAAYRADPRAASAGWRLGMACYFVGLRLTRDPRQRTALFAEGRDAARTAVRADPGCAPCHFWAAINMALYGREVGTFKMLFSLREIQDHLRASIRIDPKYASAGAYRLLGVIDERLPGILGGDNDRARRMFEQAVALAPDEPLNYLFLARLLDRELHDRSDALSIARRGAEINGLSPERLESIEAERQLRQWLEKTASNPRASGLDF